MSDVVFSSKLTKMPNCEYFSIPTIACKVLLHYKKDIELNHFERVVLGLLLNSPLTAKQISDLILLEEDLVNLILHNLIGKSYIDMSHNVTEDGKQVLEKSKQEVIKKVAYVFYDLGRNCLIDHICDSSEFQIAQAYTYNKQKCFTISNDVSDELIPFRIIFKNANKNVMNNNDLKNRIKQQIFDISMDKTLIDVEIMETDYRQTQLISMVYFSNNKKDKSYVVANPITLENDDGLYYYIASHLSDENVKSLVVDLLKKGVDDSKASKISDEKYYRLINDKLFYKPLPIDKSWIAQPLYKIIRILNQTENQNYQDLIQSSKDIKEGMLSLSEMVENVLHQIARSNGKIHSYIGELPKYDLELTLIKMAKQIGFDVNENNKILRTNRENLFRCLRNTNNPNLSDVIALNLCIAFHERNNYLYKMATDYPGFINSLYTFKREYRDKNRHDNRLGIISPREYFEVFFKLLEYGFNLEVDPAVMREIASFKEDDTSVSLARTTVDAIIDKDASFKASTSEQAIRLRTSLVSMYTSYINEESRYANNAYSIIDDCLKQMLVYFKQKYKLDYVSIKDVFADKADVIINLVNWGIVTTPYKEVPEVVMSNSISFDKDSYVTFEHNFVNSVISEEIRILITMMKTNQDILEEVLQFKEIFILATTITHITKHQQNHVFVDEVAKLICEKLLLFVSTFTYIFK